MSYQQPLHAASAVTQSSRRTNRNAAAAGTYRIRSRILAVLALVRLRCEAGATFAAIDLFVTRLLPSLDPSRRLIASKALKLLYDDGSFSIRDGQHQLTVFEGFKATSRDFFREYSKEIRRPLNEVTLLAFAFFFLEQDVPKPPWVAILNFFDKKSEYYYSNYYRVIRELVSKTSGFPVNAVHIATEDDFVLGTCLNFESHVCKDIYPPLYDYYNYNLEPLRGKYYARTPWYYVLLTYIVIIGSVITAAVLIAVSEKRNIEGILEALQVVPLFDLVYFGIWKVFSYNDKIVRDLLTGRWTIDTVADFLNYYNMELDELYSRVFFRDYKLGALLQPKLLSFANVPLLGLLSVDSPAPVHIFSKYMSHFSFANKVYVVDWLNQRVGSFKLIPSSKIGSVTWEYSANHIKLEDDVLGNDYKPNLSSTRVSRVKQLVFESDVSRNNFV